MTRPADRVPTLLGALCATVLMTSTTFACSGGADRPDGPPPSAGSRPAPPSPSPGTPSATPDPDLLARAEAVQSAQQRLATEGRGTFTVDLVRGAAGGVLPSVQGAYDFSVPAGSFTAVTDEGDRTVRLRYRTRGGQAWSQVLYPGSPLAPDCWYQLGLAEGAVAMPSQLTALLYLQPDPADPRGDRERATVALADALNAVGLTRLANLLNAEAGAVRVPVVVRVENESDDARFEEWVVAGTDVLAALEQAPVGRGAGREAASVRDDVAQARWRIALQPGDSSRVVAPPGNRVLVAGDSCS